MEVPAEPDTPCRIWNPVHVHMYMYVVSCRWADPRLPREEKTNKRKLRVLNWLGSEVRPSMVSVTQPYTRFTSLTREPCSPMSPGTPSHALELTTEAGIPGISYNSSNEVPRPSTNFTHRFNAKPHHVSCLMTPDPAGINLLLRGCIFIAHPISSCRLTRA